MKLLLDENLSYRVVSSLAIAFPGSTQVDEINLHGASDFAIWQFAGDNDFIIVSKDDDFRQLSFVRGAPPKVIWLAIGNAGTEIVHRLLIDQTVAIQTFFEDAETSLLVLQVKEAAQGGVFEA